MMTSVASYFARSQVHLHALPRRSCVSVNIKIRVDTAGTTTSYPKAGSRVSRTLDNLKILPIVAANSFILTEALRQSTRDSTVPLFNYRQKNRGFCLFG